MNKPYLSLGLMSGTSMDGVDASIIQSDGENQYHGVFDQYFKYNNEIYKNLSSLRDKITKYRKPNYNNVLLENLSQEFKDIEKKITLFHADVVNKIIKDKFSVDLIGFHGQTIFHNPLEKKSIQLGDGKLLSKLTNKTVIYNFRENDIKNGGGGAPLTPIFHLLLAKKKLNPNALPVLILNIGGIANVTGVNHYDNSKNDQIFALDVGPGNCLIDQWMRKKSEKNYDENGMVAKSGKINKTILDKGLRNWVNNLDETCLSNNINLPRSHDVGDYDYSFANALSLEDGAATITEYSSEIYSHFINKLMNNYPKAVIVCGGGRKNKFLMESFKKKIKCSLIKIDDFSIDGDFIESQAFAYLAIRSFLKLPISFPETSGVRKPCTGGVIIKN